MVLPYIQQGPHQPIKPGLFISFRDTAELEYIRSSIHVSAGEQQSQNECDHSVLCDMGGTGEAVEYAFCGAGCIVCCTGMKACCCFSAMMFDLILNGQLSGQEGRLRKRYNSLD